MTNKRKLTEAIIKSLKPQDKIWSVADSKCIGLRLRIMPNGSKRYLYNYRPSKDVPYTSVAIGNSQTMNIEQARAAADKMRVAIIEKRSPRDLRELKKSQLTLAELINDYEKKKLPTLAASSQSVFQSLVGCWIFQDCTKEENHKIVSQMPDISQKLVEDITLEDVEDLKNGVEQSSKASADKLIKLMRAVFNYGIKRKKVKNNPFAEVELDKKLAKKEDNRIYTPHERERIISNAIVYKGARINLEYYKSLKLNPVALCLIGYAALTGRRYVSEGAILKFSNIDFDNKTLVLAKSKVGAWTYALSEATLKLLKAIKLETLDPESPFCNPDGYIFPSATWIKDKGWEYRQTHINEPKKVWSKFCKILKIERYPLKQLRHTTATALLKSSKNLAMVQRALGHSNISTTARYAKILADDYRAEINALDQVNENAAEVIKFKKV